jgi:hypothetical protein
VPIGKLRPAKDNPRTIPQRAVDVLALGLQRFGWKQPLVADKDGTLVVGHTRLLAAKKLGLTTVPVVFAEDLSPEELHAYRIADNRTHDFTTWDYPVLVEQLDQLAGDFSEVLALADWETIVNNFEDSTDLADLGLGDEIEGALNAFEIVVCFRSEEDALQAEKLIVDMQGVIDVRHKR